MSAKDRIIQQIQATADATDDNQVRISFGAPGEYLLNIINERKATGQVWQDLTLGTWPMIIEALASHLHGVRRIVSSGNLNTLDSIVELGSNGVTLTLPNPSEDYAGKYIVKAVGTQGTAVNGSVDGGPGPFPVVDYDVFRVYCNGFQWLTW
ncbi:MAG: hypothetical protein KAV87_53125 [Desulfobacteraceae bacterium]|nr:hypothetical protein [Desulfobacteraceae bacterium]